MVPDWKWSATEMIVTHENLGTWTKNLSYSPLVHWESYADCRGIEIEVPRTVCVRYLVDKVALGWGFLWESWFPLVSVVSSVLHTHNSSPIDTTQYTHWLDHSIIHSKNQQYEFCLEFFLFYDLHYMAPCFCIYYFPFHMMINSR
jgi:hypothetical protein